MTKIATHVLRSDATDPDDLDLLALKYNVSQLDARHIVYAAPIEQAVLRGQAKTLRNFEQTPGFRQRLRRIVIPKRAALTEKPRELLNVVTSLDGLSTDDPELWQSVIAAASGARNWPTHGSMDGIAIVMRRAPGDVRLRIAQNVIDAFAAGLQTTPKDPQQDEVARWIANANAFLAHARAAAYPPIGGSTLFRLRILLAIETRELSWPVAVPITTTDADALMDRALSAVRTSERTYMPAIRRLAQIGQTWDWTATIERVEEHVVTAGAMNALAAVGAIVQFLLILERTGARPEARAKLDRWCESGDALRILASSWNSEFTAATLLIVLVTRRTDVKVTGWISNAAPGPVPHHDEIIAFLRNPETDAGRRDEAHRVSEEVGGPIGPELDAAIVRVGEVIAARGGLRVVVR